MFAPQGTPAPPARVIRLSPHRQFRIVGWIRNEVTIHHGTFKRSRKRSGPLDNGGLLRESTLQNRHATPLGSVGWIRSEVTIHHGTFKRSRKRSDPLDNGGLLRESTLDGRNRSIQRRNGGLALCAESNLCAVLVSIGNGGRP